MNNKAFQHYFLLKLLQKDHPFFIKNPTTCLLTWAGLLKGPIKLKIVFLAIFFLAANMFHCLMIIRANIKAKLTFSIDCSASLVLN